ncbi:MAG: carbon monoxide dehydrogenase subunit G [Alphaproteobacteria bacterium]
MDLNGAYLIQASPEAVWAALNDPDKLREALPGCESLTKTSDNEFEAVATQSIGPVKARFKGKVALHDLNPPRSYTIKGEGSGGAAGFAKGEAKVELIPDQGGTRLVYAVKATVGGKIAQIGQRLIDGVARKLADEFFERFSAGFGEVQTVDAATGEKVERPRGGLPPLVWAAGLVAVVAALIWLALSL